MYVINTLHLVRILEASDNLCITFYLDLTVWEIQLIEYVLLLYFPLIFLLTPLKKTFHNSVVTAHSNKY